MSGNHRMPKGESDGALWDIWWHDSPRTLEATREHGVSFALKTRILSLRSSLVQTAWIVQAIPDSPEKEQILRLIANELATLEWDLLT